MLKFISFLLMFATGLAGAQQANSPAEDAVTEEVQQPSPLTELGSDYENSITLLQNRFRIDHQVEEITMIFFRKYGSAPVVLVRPDGSKIFATRAIEEDVFWYDTATYDMISIKNPMPGPWQAVGQVLPESRVMVLSDIKLHAEPLPSIIFSGEILKQTAYLTNGDQPIEYTQFSDVVSLSIDFHSTNNPNFDNFGAKSEQIARFEDNGMSMDERPFDGIFTGQFNLAVVPGEWTPKFKVQTPMFSREQVDEPVMLYANPIQIAVELDVEGDSYHRLVIDAERELVDISTLLIDGKVRFPNGDLQAFSLTELSDQAREHLIVNYEYGVYRVNLTAYGKTVNGRDFILDVPEYSFLSEAPELQATSVPDSLSEDTADAQMNEQAVAVDVTTQMPATDQQTSSEQQLSTNDTVILVVVINGMLLIGGIGIIWWVMGRSKTAQADASMAEPSGEQPQAPTAESAPSAWSNFIGKLSQLLPFGKKSGQATDEQVLNSLSMPKE